MNKILVKRLYGVQVSFKMTWRDLKRFLSMQASRKTDMKEGMTYLTTAELSERIKYDTRTIRERLKDSVLLEGFITSVHLEAEKFYTSGSRPSRLRPFSLIDSYLVWQKRTN
jgi:hypothetical protein